MMSPLNKILFKVFSKKLKQNVKFKDIHKGESCYIFGNGASLKYFDLKMFNDRVSIGCGSLFSHIDINHINLKYHYIAHPLFFYKFWKNPYSKKYEKNKVGCFYRKNIKNHPDVEYFTSLSNYFGIQGKNINYVYHFGQANSRNVENQMNGIFSMMTGSLSGMIGTALYMGFQNITLVGCDYTSTPQKVGHFFEFGEGEDMELGGLGGDKLLSTLNGHININTMTINKNYCGTTIPSISYFEHTNSQPVYKENNKVVSKKSLVEIESLKYCYKIFQDED
jgi:hypothetical protein